MKKIILLLAFMVPVTLSFCQTKSVKPQYNYSITLPENVYAQLVNIAHDFKDQQIYNQKLTTDQKVTISQSIDMYLFNLPKSIKVDSVLAVADTTKINFKPIKNKS
jgi:hypothetical protein